MGEIIQQTDFQILDWIQANVRSPFLDWFAPKITFLGNAGWFWFLLTLIFLLWRKHRRCGMTMFIALVLGALIGVVLLKNLVARPRPCWINQDISMLIEIPKDYSFPSGHSLISFASATVLFRYKKRIGISALILALVIALSRLYLYVHFPTDVIAGILLGILFAAIAIQIIRRFESQETVLIGSKMSHEGRF